MITLTANALTILAVAVGLGPQARPAADYEGDCSSAGCHDQYGNRSFVHDPISGGSCDDCHVAASGQEQVVWLEQLMCWCSTMTRQLI